MTLTKKVWTDFEFSGNFPCSGPARPGGTDACSRRLGGDSAGCAAGRDRGWPLAGGDAGLRSASAMRHRADCGERFRRVGRLDCSAAGGCNRSYRASQRARDGVENEPEHHAARPGLLGELKRMREPSMQETQHDRVTGVLNRGTMLTMLFWRDGSATEAARLARPDVVCDRRPGLLEQ